MSNGYCVCFEKAVLVSCVVVRHHSTGRIMREITIVVVSSGSDTRVFLTGELKNPSRVLFLGFAVMLMEVSSSRRVPVQCRMNA